MSRVKKRHLLYPSRGRGTADAFFPKKKGLEGRLWDDRLLEGASILNWIIFQQEKGWAKSSYKTKFVYPSKMKQKGNLM